MKTFKLYTSFMRTFLRSGLKLNILVFVISVAAILSFVSVICTFRSTTVDFDRDRTGKPYYQMKFNDKINDDTTRILKDKMPEIVRPNKYSSAFYYYSREKDVLCTGEYYPAFPKIWNEVSVYFNETYTVYEGRDITEEERNEEKGVIIASKNSMLSVGDDIILPLKDGEATLRVIGISDNFIIPTSYLVRYYDRLKVETDEPPNYYFSYLSMPLFELEFIRDLNFDEAKILESITEWRVRCYEPGEHIINKTVTYVLSATGMVIVAVFTALQVYTLFLYLASKVSYQTAVCEICGCSNVKITAVIMLAVFTYIVFSVAAGAALMPVFIRFTEFCRMNYIPTFFDFLLSLAIYMIVVSIAILPGIKKISDASLAGEVK